MRIQAIRADSYQSRTGSCQVVATREDYILRLVYQKLNLKQATKMFKLPDIHCYVPFIDVLFYLFFKEKQGI